MTTTKPTTPHDPLYVGNLCTSEYTVLQWKAKAEAHPELVAALHSALAFVRRDAADEVSRGISATDGHACGEEHRLMALLARLGE